MTKKPQEFKDNMMVVSLASAKQPVFLESKTKDWISYGEEDDYPKYLVSLFNKSAKHNAIITNKVQYVMGKGFGLADTDIKDLHKNKTAYGFINRINSNEEDINEVAVKAAMDLELYGGFYLEIVWNMAKQISDINHVDYCNYRSNKDNTQFYYRPDGDFYTQKKAEIIPAFNPAKPTGKQILYFKDYRPGISTYTLPGYMGALNYIEADIEVGKHTYTNAIAGFMPSKMIHFNNGEPDDEQKRAINNRFGKMFTGTDGQKYIITFNQSKETAPTIDDLGASDLSKEDFSVTDNLITQNIYAGHKITSPILFGIKEAGQLGGRNEMREAYEIFQNIYANAQQQKLEMVFNWLASFNGITDKLEIMRSEPVGFEFSEGIIAQNLTQTEVRERIGATHTDSENPELAEAIDKIKLLPSKVQDIIIGTLDPNELRAMVGLAPTEIKEEPKQEPVKFSASLDVINDLGFAKDDYLIVKSKPVHFSANIDMIESELSFYRHEFADLEIDINTKQAQILDLIKKDKRISNEDIAKALKISVKEVATAINLLINKEYINEKITVRDGVETKERTLSPGVSKEVKKETVKEISVKYSYEEKKNIPPAESGSRPFCAKLMELDRLYTRQDIETMSERLGYSVFDRKGGWYNNPETGVTSPECRHEWRQNLVVKKIS